MAPMNVSAFSRAQGFSASSGGLDSRQATSSTKPATEGLVTEERGWEECFTDGFVRCSKCTCMFTERHIKDHELRCTVKPGTLATIDRSQGRSSLLSLRLEWFQMSKSWHLILMSVLVCCHCLSSLLSMTFFPQCSSVLQQILVRLFA